MINSFFLLSLGVFFIGIISHVISSGKKIPTINNLLLKGRGLLPSRSFLSPLLWGMIGFSLWYWNLTRPYVEENPLLLGIVIAGLSLIPFLPFQQEEKEKKVRERRLISIMVAFATMAGVSILLETEGVLTPVNPAFLIIAETNEVMMKRDLSTIKAEMNRLKEKVERENLSQEERNFLLYLGEKYDSTEAVYKSEIEKRKRPDGGLGSIIIRRGKAIKNSLPSLISSITTLPQQQAKKKPVEVGYEETHWFKTGESHRLKLKQYERFESLSLTPEGRRVKIWWEGGNKNANTFVSGRKFPTTKNPSDSATYNLLMEGNGELVKWVIYRGEIHPPH